MPGSYSVSKHQRQLVVSERHHQEGGVQMSLEKAVAFGNVVAVVSAVLERNRRAKHAHPSLRQEPGGTLSTCLQRKSDVFTTHWTSYLPNCWSLTKQPPEQEDASRPLVRHGGGGRLCNQPGEVRRHEEGLREARWHKERETAHSVRVQQRVMHRDDRSERGRTDRDASTVVPSDVRKEGVKLIRKAAHAQLLDVVGDSRTAVPVQVEEQHFNVELVSQSSSGAQPALVGLRPRQLHRGSAQTLQQHSPYKRF
eukprot:243970-Pleurochrysis_carterae.AAC.2